MLTWRWNPDDPTLHSHQCMNLKCNILKHMTETICNVFFWVSTRIVWYDSYICFGGPTNSIFRLPLLLWRRSTKTSFFSTGLLVQIYPIPTYSSPENWAKAILLSQLDVLQNNMDMAQKKSSHPDVTMSLTPDPTIKKYSITLVDYYNVTFHEHLVIWSFLRK